MLHTIHSLYNKLSSRTSRPTLSVLVYILPLAVPLHGWYGNVQTNGRGNKIRDDLYLSTIQLANMMTF